MRDTSHTLSFSLVCRCLVNGEDKSVHFYVSFRMYPIALINSTFCLGKGIQRTSCPRHLINLDLSPSYTQHTLNYKSENQNTKVSGKLLKLKIKLSCFKQHFPIINLPSIGLKRCLKMKPSLISSKKLDTKALKGNMNKQFIRVLYMQLTLISLQQEKGFKSY